MSNADDVIGPSVDDVIGPIVDDVIGPIVDDVIGPIVDDVIGPSIEVLIGPSIDGDDVRRDDSGSAVVSEFSGSKADPTVILLSGVTETKRVGVVIVVIGTEGIDTVGTRGECIDLVPDGMLSVAVEIVLIM